MGRVLSIGLWTPSLLLLVLLGLTRSTVHAEYDTSNGTEWYHFVTRPDISAPRWRIKTFDKERVSPGYWFVAPYDHIAQTEPGTAMVGPHIYDQNGELIWSGAPFYGNWNNYDFKVSNILGEDFMTSVVPSEEAAVIMSDHFEIRQKVHIGKTGATLNMHDFSIVDNGTRAVAMQKAFGRETDEGSHALGFTQGGCQAIWGGFQEFKAETWEQIFSWSSEGHIGLNESTWLDGSLEERCERWWDFIHANSIDKFPNGDYLLSGRHTDTIYKISHRDGSIIWRLGGIASDFKSDLVFSRQHDARLREHNETHTVLTFLDNARGTDEQGPTNDRSRGVAVALHTDVRPMTATLLAHYDHPYGAGGYNLGRGNYQALPDGNVFMCWSDEVLHSEYTAQGKMIVEAELMPKGLRTYRGYKHPFVGRPNTAPEVYSSASTQGDHSTTTTVYVSWNGATEVAGWYLHKANETGEATLRVASEPRLGFETVLEYAGYASYVLVEAVDKDGKTLGVSSVVKTVAASNLDPEALAGEALWLQDAARPTTPEATRFATLLANPVFTFFAGNVCSALVLLGSWLAWQRGILGRFKRSSYEPLQEGDEEEGEEEDDNSQISYNQDVK